MTSHLLPLGQKNSKTTKTDLKKKNWGSYRSWLCARVAPVSRWQPWWQPRGAARCRRSVRGAPHRAAAEPGLPRPPRGAQASPAHPRPCLPGPACSMRPSPSSCASLAEPGEGAEGDWSILHSWVLNHTVKLFTYMHRDSFSTSLPSYSIDKLSHSLQD